ncbi:MAG TPA: amidohydrolase family protein [Acidimicrobiales bacterium]|nr:amidohydrolase family protein [Acidimicrobiales bacterium]
MELTEVGPQPQFRRPFVPDFAVVIGRRLRAWKALGPRLGLYSPLSTLELPDNTPERAAVPAVNFHTHLGRWLSPRGGWVEPDVERLLSMMDACNVSSLVNLDGRWGRELEENLQRYDQAHPGRFYSFCHVNWQLLELVDGPERLVKSLEASAAAGAKGLKVWKDLGTRVTVKGRRLLPDDPVLAPLWEAAGALKLPVLIHIADPVAFFLPVDRHNERLEELLRHPRGSRQGEGVEEHRRLTDALEQMVSAHPRTKIVAAHGFYPENLARVKTMFDSCENFHIDVAWAHLQLGRQPRAAAELVSAYPERVLFGSDVFPLRAAILRTYFRFLETNDESFPYTDEDVPGSGRWPIHGLGLPMPVLQCVYRDNAIRLLGPASSSS